MKLLNDRRRQGYCPGCRSEHSMLRFLFLIVVVEEVRGCVLPPVIVNVSSTRAINTDQDNSSMLILRLFTRLYTQLIVSDIHSISARQTHAIRSHSKTGISAQKVIAICSVYTRKPCRSCDTTTIPRTKTLAHDMEPNNMFRDNMRDVK